MDLKPQIKDFMNYLMVEKGFSHNTKLAYQQDLDKFSSYLNDKEIKNLDVIDYHFFVSFLRSLQIEEYAPASSCRVLACLKTFFKFLKREDYVKTNAARYLERPKLWQKIPNILEIEEVDQLINASKQKFFKGSELRNTAVLELLYGSGLRVSELINLQVKDLEGDFVKVNGKGNKQRIVPITNKFKVALQRYWKKKRSPSDLKHNEYMFTTRSLKKIDRMHIWQIIKKCAALAGITKNISPHTLRHSLATHLLRNKGNIRVIQEILGHENIATTSHYLHLCTGDLTKALLDFHPHYDL